MSRRAAEAGRRHPDRQDHDTRVRAHALHGGPAVRPHAQCLGARTAPAAAPRAARRWPRRRRRPHGVGTDAGGSTRIPAACNGVVGFKQSAGVIPHDMSPEVFANVSSINPMARTVCRCGLMLEAMAGEHPSDPYPTAPRRAASSPRRGREGVPEGPARRLAAADGEHVPSTARCWIVRGGGHDAWASSAPRVEPMDDDLEPVEPIWFAYASALWNARFGDAAAAMGQPAEPDAARGRWSSARRRPASAVGRALLARTQLYRKVQGWFERFDVIVTPTLTRTAIPIEERLFEPIEIEGERSIPCAAPGTPTRIPST